MLKKIKPLLPFLLATLSGFAMTYGFAPYYFGMAAMVSTGVFLGCLKNQKPRRAFLIGWLYGLGMFTGGSWIYVSIHDYGNASPALAFLITVIFIMGLALYPATLGWVLARFFPRQNAIRCVLAFPVLWVLFEIVRGWFLTGFPWLYVGYAEMGNHLRAFAPLGGVWLVSWMTVLFASMLYTLLDYYYEHQRNHLLHTSLIVGAMAIWGTAFYLSQIKWVQPTSHRLNVALVQGNIGQLLRWDPLFVQEIIQTYESLTYRALDSDVIIWPEAAIPLSLPLSKPIFDRVGHALSARNIGLIAGVPTELPDKMHYTNALTTAGNAMGEYHKTHLVPFGEYVPLEKYLRGIIGFFDLPMSSMESGPKKQAPLIAHGYRFAPAICYEIAYPIFVQTMSKDTDFILTVSNDAWFGKSIGPAQHLQIAQFRALENGQYVLRATNTGFSAIIRPDGSISAMSPQFQPDVLRGTVTAMQGKTPWNRLGAWPVLCALAATLLLAFLLNRRQK